MIEWVLVHWSKIVFSIVILYVIRLCVTGTFTKLRKRLDGKIIIVTGASAGIGKATAFQLLEDGAEVIFACRNKEKTMRVFKEIEEKNKDFLERAHFIELNLSSFNSVINFVKEFKLQFPKLDILINNAGGFPMTFEITEDNIEDTLQSNHLSPQVLTTLLLDHFDKKEGRIIMVSSFAHIQSDWCVEKINDLKSDKDFKSIEKTYFGSIWSKHYHYSSSKLGNIYFTSHLAEHIDQHYPHIKVACLSPGLVYTEIGRFIFEHPTYRRLKFLRFTYYYIAKTALGGAQTQLHLCYLDQNEFINGGYYDNCKLANISRLAKNREVRDLMIRYSWDLIKNHKELNNINF